MRLENPSYLKFLQGLQETQTFYDQHENLLTENSDSSILEEKHQELSFHLFHTLEAIQKAYEKLYFTSGDGKLRLYEKMVMEYISIYNKQEVTKLKQELSKQESLAETEGGHEEKILVLTAFIHNLDSTFEVKRERQESLLKILKTVDQWGIYELSLFSNAGSILDIETLCELAKGLIEHEEREDFFCENPQYKPLFVRVLLNVALECIEKNQLSMGNLFKNCADDLIRDDFRLLLEKNIFHFANGYYLAKTGDVSCGMRCMKKTITVFFQLEYDDKAELYADYLKNHIYPEIYGRPYDENADNLWEEIYQDSLKEKLDSDSDSEDEI